MMMRVVAIAAAGLLGAVAALERVLLVHDGEAPAALHEYLAKHGANFAPTTVKLSDLGGKDSAGRLIDAGTDRLAHEHLLLLGGKLPKGIKNEALLEYVKRGGNLLWVLPDTVGTLDARTKTLALELGRVLDSQPARIRDYAAVGNASAVPVRIASETAERVFHRPAGPEERFAGWSHRLDPDNPLVFPLLTARPEALGVCAEFLGFDRCVPPLGADNVLASAMTTRANSRAVIVSGDAWFRAEQPSPLAEQLIAWTFQQSGQLRVDTFVATSLEGRADGRGHRIGDRIELKVCLSTRRFGSSRWEPAQPADMQMELTMLDAWLRADLAPTADGCLATGAVRLPDRYGTYSLRVRYQRRGWPHLLKSEPFIIRPFHHDEAQRQVPSALPYYVAWFGMMASSALLVLPLIFPVSK